MLDAEYRGALVEIGSVISVGQGTLTVESLTRPGIRAQGIAITNGAVYAPGDAVFFFVFPNGAGMALGKIN